MKRRRVEHDQPFHPFGKSRRPRRADHSAPVVQNERHVVVELQMIQKRGQIGDAALEAIWVLRQGRLIGQSAADVIGYDAAIAAAEAQDEVAVEERPCRIAVHHHDGRAVAFVEVMHSDAGADLEKMAGERIKILMDGWRVRGQYGTGPCR
jgi:hypothetical protein